MRPERTAEQKMERAFVVLLGCAHMGLVAIVAGGLAIGRLIVEALQ